MKLILNPGALDLATLRLAFREPVDVTLADHADPAIVASRAAVDRE